MGLKIFFLKTGETNILNFNRNETRGKKKKEEIWKMNTNTSWNKILKKLKMECRCGKKPMMGEGNFPWKDQRNNICGQGYL